MTSAFLPPHPLRTGVLFLVFNRPDTTARVFQAIRQAKPPRLYVAADGPRETREGEAELVARVRQIATAVDWPCDVFTLFRENNLGCKKAISEAITWFFEREDRGIILEDDCLPHPDFFTFCEVLLERYAENKMVSVVTGNNFQNEIYRGDGSYYFSRYNHVWGWASWRRAWKYYDGDLSFWPEWKRYSVWHGLFPSKMEKKYWEKIFDLMHAKKIDTWDYPWTASVWRHGGLTATPNVNLISNIGFGPESTHTANPNDRNANRPIKALGKITHPTNIRHDREADIYTFDYHYGGRWQRFPLKILHLPRRIIGFLYRNIRKRQSNLSRIISEELSKEDQNERASGRY
jgi:hypothetical protein